MINVTLMNIHTSGELDYKFEVLPRKYDTISLDGFDLRDNEDWQAFAGADKDDLYFEGFDDRTFLVVNVNHKINSHGITSITLLLDEFYGKDPGED